VICRNADAGSLYALVSRPLSKALVLQQVNQLATTLFQVRDSTGVLYNISDNTF
jgi:hypothetical protein